MITIYVTSWCPYCNAAKRLLREKNLEYEVIDIEQAGISREQLVKITGGRSVPQIVIDGKPIGGYGELMALDRAGKLPEPVKERG
ncbi:MAG: glutaredoxin 3 [FCB group bacterium]|nr:glutaredoxin 3 [FCB group bacterium]